MNITVVQPTDKKIFPLPQILKTKHCISEASSRETAHLKVLVANICVSAAYISDTNYKNISITMIHTSVYNRCEEHTMYPMFLTSSSSSFSGPSF
jgi:hypothetical protein